MREHKYRIWDRENKQMIYDQEIVLLPRGGWHTPLSQRPILDNANAELLECIGLGDESLKRIYEGDIVYYLGQNQKIAWSDTLARFVLKPYTVERHYDINAHVAKECKIIGNIYENPELLNY